MAEQEELELTGEESTEKVEIGADELQEIKDRASRLETKLNEAEIQKARLEGRTEVQPTAPATTEVPILTREQLQAAVDDGRINQSQMDTELARQMRDSLKAEIGAEIGAEQNQRDQFKIVEEQFQKYLEWKPSVSEEGSEDRRRVQDEFKALIELGYPPDEKRTEVAAMRAVFGPVDRVQETTRGRRETHAETGGAGGSAVDETSENWEKGLTANQRSTFKHQLTHGGYTDEDDKDFKSDVLRARTKNKAA